jgi:uncharacterized protein YbbC (DUF1343 family)
MKISLVILSFCSFIFFHLQLLGQAGKSLVYGDARMDQILPALEGKQVALMVNQTAMVGTTHLLDTLISQGINVKKIFAPEHGLRGNADAGAHIKDSIDEKTGLPVISVYGNKKKPTGADLKGIDVVVFDIQDVGARFFTFISSLHYLMEACAENNVPLIVLDRPNPNGGYVAGPVLQKEFSSFVGVDPVPIVYGLTEGEYAQMVNGENWLSNGMQCKLKVITCLNYSHEDKVSLPIKPSPNLPNSLAVALYPSLCMFEGTNVSVGRGTSVPFQVIGSPKTKLDGAFEFTPKSKPGAANPPYLNQVCYGFDLRSMEDNYGALKFSFNYILQMYRLCTDKSEFFLKNNFFDKLVGTDTIRKMIVDGMNEKEIVASYYLDLEAYKMIRKKYLLYKDFEQ